MVSHEGSWAPHVAQLPTHSTAAQGPHFDPEFHPFLCAIDVMINAGQMDDLIATARQVGVMKAPLRALGERMRGATLEGVRKLETVLNELHLAVDALAEAHRRQQAYLESHGATRERVQDALVEVLKLQKGLAIAAPQGSGLFDWKSILRKRFLSVTEMTIFVSLCHRDKIDLHGAAKYRAVYREQWAKAGHHAESDYLAKMSMARDQVSKDPKVAALLDQLCREHETCGASDEQLWGDLVEANAREPAQRRLRELQHALDLAETNIKEMDNLGYADNFMVAAMRLVADKAKKDLAIARREDKDFRGELQHLTFRDRLRCLSHARRASAAGRPPAMPMTVLNFGEGTMDKALDRAGNQRTADHARSIGAALASLTKMQGWVCLRHFVFPQEIANRAADCLRRVEKGKGPGGWQVASLAEQLRDLIDLARHLETESKADDLMARELQVLSQHVFTLSFLLERLTACEHVVARLCPRRTRRAAAEGEQAPSAQTAAEEDGDLAMAVDQHDRELKHLRALFPKNDSSLDD
ncbi:MAG: hypothetical protein EOO40_02840, partial [Deltaproteobacteria bacterium]